MKDLCRLCLIPGNGQDIFQNKLDKVIEECFGIKLIMLENWPSHTCPTCLDYLMGLRDFKEKIEVSQESLKRMEFQTIIKEEPIMQTFEEVAEEIEVVTEEIVIEKSEELEVDNRRKSSRLITKVIREAPIKREKRITNRSRSSLATISVGPEKEAKRKYEKRKIKSPSPMHNEEESGQSEDDSNGESQMEESNNSLDESKQTYELRASFEAQMKRMNLLYCKDCKYEADSFRLLNRHYQEEHQKRGYITCCNKKLHRKDLADHMKFHLDANAFKCKECGKILKSGAQLRSHTTNKHTNPVDYKFKCETCGKKIPTRGQYNSHLKSHIPRDQRAFKCKLCPKSFNLETHLQKHIVSIHEHPTTHVCEICGKGMASADHLRVHGLTHRAAKTTECDICGKHYFYMAIHKKRIHGPQTWTRCEYCGIMVNQIYYKKHLKRLHDNSKMHKCHICDKEFRILINYNVHMDIHYGIKYDCYFCPHQATSIPNRIKHMKDKHKEEYFEFRKNKFTEARVKNVQ